MPSVVTSSSTVVREARSASTRPGGALKPADVDATKRKSQSLVASESSHRNVKSVERSGGAPAASTASSSVSSRSLVSSRSSTLAEKPLRQKVDLCVKPAAVARTAASRVGPARHATVNSTRVKSDSGESVKSEPCRATDSRSAAVKSTRTSGTVATQLSTGAKTAVPPRRSAAEASRRDDVSASAANKRRSLQTSVTGGVKHEVPPLSRGTGPVAAAASHSKTNSSTAACLATSKKPRLKQASGTALTTGRTAVKQAKASLSGVRQLDKTSDVRKCSASKVAEFSLVAAVDVVPDNVAVSSDRVPDPVTPANTSGTLPRSDCVVVDKLREEVASLDQISSDIHTDESALRESARSSSLAGCEHVLKSNSVIVPPVTCIHEDCFEDLEDTSVCDISLNSCRSDNSISLFHSACSSIIGSVGDVKPPSLHENDNLGMWSRSNSVSVDSLPSSAGYCTPSELQDDNFSEAADCTLSSTADARFESLFLLLAEFLS